MRVIAAIDNSAAARPVLAAAEAVAHVLGADVEAVHVPEDGTLTARGAAEAAAVPLTLLDGGDVAPQVVAAAGSDDVAAIAIGTRRTPAGARPGGHVCLDVITAVQKPAIVVPPEAQANDKLHSVLVPMMGHPTKAASVRGAITLVNASHIEVIVVHVYDEATIPAFSDQPQYETQAWAQEFLARYVPIPPDAVRLELRVGVPIEQIMRVRSETNADAIAMGWTQDISPGRGLLVRAVLERSPVPVILLPVLAAPGN